MITTWSLLLGHACLPGGRKEESDRSFVETALREAHEEVDLRQEQVEVVCTLPRYASITGRMMLSPVVATTKVTPDQLNLLPNPNEVDCFYWVPLQFFIDEAPTRERIQLFDFKYFFTESKTGKVHFIWGLTAYLCLIISCMALNKVPDASLQRATLTSSTLQGEDSFLLTYSEIPLTREAATMLTSKL